MQTEYNKCMFVLFIFEVNNMLFHETLTGIHRRTGGAELFFASFKGWVFKTLTDIKWDRKNHVSSQSCWWEYWSGIRSPLVLLSRPPSAPFSTLVSVPSCLAAFSVYPLTLLHLSLSPSLLTFSASLPHPPLLSLLSSLISWGLGGSSCCSGCRCAGLEPISPFKELIWHKRIF